MCHRRLLITLGRDTQETCFVKAKVTGSDVNVLGNCPYRLVCCGNFFDHQQYQNKTEVHSNDEHFDSTAARTYIYLQFTHNMIQTYRFPPGVNVSFNCIQRHYQQSDVLGRGGAWGTWFPAAGRER